VPYARERIYEVLTDPSMVARLTPFVKSIVPTPDGEHWIWTMSGIQVGGYGFTATFTEKMTLTEPSRLDFAHDPPEGKPERAAVAGHYVLTELGPEETRLETSLEVCIDLPLPRVSKGMVGRTMKGVMGTMGDRFSKNLLDHLSGTTHPA